MCTVSYFKDKEQVTLTSNRDEQMSRPTALAPQKTVINGITMYYPVDPLSEGTWFCVKESGDVLILLNGANEKHISQPPYRKSRGLVLLDLAKTADLIQTWSNISLDKIEPFTVVAYSNRTLVQLRWNSQVKSLLHLDANLPYIWSSATLYTPEAQQMRKQWFFDFINRHHGKPNTNDLLDFHTKTAPTDTHNGLIINRNETMRTQSVTQCNLQTDQFKLSYYDVKTHQTSVIKASLT